MFYLPSRLIIHLLQL
uniref:Uncharacterized protein n=1 Tax=Anguilla anguilla TaxID=7936 RepID=A0A0E9W166_ANGAN